VNNKSKFSFESFLSFFNLGIIKVKYASISFSPDAPTHQNDDKKE
jgi:hypothetical protein